MTWDPWGLLACGALLVSTVYYLASTERAKRAEREKRR